MAVHNTSINMPIQVLATVLTGSKAIDTDAVMAEIVRNLPSFAHDLLDKKPEDVGVTDDSLWAQDGRSALEGHHTCFERSRFESASMAF